MKGKQPSYYSQHQRQQQQEDDDGEDHLILSQDIFCTPDYMTPENQNLLATFDSLQENIPSCPNSPDNKRRRPGPERNPNPTVLDISSGPDNVTNKSENYVSPFAVALRCRVMPPPCIKNPYTKDVSQTHVDPFGNSRIKCEGLFPGMLATHDGPSRYHMDFQEIEQIGAGNSSRVFKVLKRVDGCFYAVKRSTRQLNLDSERRKALMEVQALAALGFHENIVGYYSSWLEDNQLYVQMELCDGNLSHDDVLQLYTEEEARKVLHQIAKALRYIHESGMAHLDVKAENIYVKDGVYKLGGFGCATLLAVEEGQKEKQDRMDIFSLGATIYELVGVTSLCDSRSSFLFNFSGTQLSVILPPGYSLQFKDLLEAMMDPDPNRRPCARVLVENPIFNGIN